MDVAHSRVRQANTKNIFFKKIKLRTARPHTSPRPHTLHTPKTRPTPRCANARAHGHASKDEYTHPVIHVNEFKSKQNTTEIDPNKVVPMGMLDFLSFGAFLGRFQKYYFFVLCSKYFSFFSSSFLQFFSSLVLSFFLFCVILFYLLFLIKFLSFEFSILMKI